MNVPANDFPALNGQTVTERHTRICRENGHAVHKIDGTDQIICPRCGDARQEDAIAIDTPAGISAWHFLSRMHQLALELNTGMKAGRLPILRAMYQQGLIDAELRGTRANKRAVLALMVDTYRENVPGWEASASVKRALSD